MADKLAQLAIKKMAEEYIVHIGSDLLVVRLELLLHILIESSGVRGEGVNAVLLSSSKYDVIELRHTQSSILLQPR